MLEQPRVTEPLASSPPITSPRRSRVLVLATVVVVAIGAIIIATRTSEPVAPVGQGSDTVSSDGGGVTVAATWLRDQPASTFRIALDTHTVDLDGINLDELAVLRVNGTEYQPTSWQAPAGGHHREGTLTFAEADVPDGATVELVVRDVAGVAERTLKWMQ